MEQIVILVKYSFPVTDISFGKTVILGEVLEWKKCEKAQKSGIKWLCAKGPWPKLL